MYTSFFRKLSHCIIATFLVGMLTGCEKEDALFQYTGMGLRPIYVQGDDYYRIENNPSQPIIQSGSIYLQDPFLFIADLGKGVHVFDVSDPAMPLSLTFIRIPAISGFTITGNILYADSWMDLVTIDISDLYNIVVLDRQKNVFEPYLFPPDYSGIFECVNPERGAVIGWEEIYLGNAQCRTTQ